MTLPVERFSEVEEYITLLTGSADTPMTWRLFGDHSALPAKVFKATLEEAEQELVEANERGYGVYANVNETNGGGKKVDVTRIRAVYAEFDGGKYTEPPLEPTFVVDSKNGKHLYWVLADVITVAQAEDLLRRIIHLLGSDPKIKDASRVLRVPGFVHMKDPEDPYEVSLSVPDLPKKWSYSQLIDAFPEVRQESIKLSSIADNPSAVGGKCQGDVTDTNYGLAAAAAEFDKICAIQRGNGETNEAVYMAAFKLATLFHSDLTEATALEYIQRACERIGYTPANGEHDVPGTIESGFRAGRENPRADRVAPVAKQDEPVRSVTEYLVSSSSDDVITELRRRASADYKPIPSPLGGLNLILGGGAAPAAVTLVGAAPGMGKSSFCLSWCDYVAQKGKPALYLSLEMKKVDCISRLATLRKRVSWIEVKSGQHIKLVSDVLRSLSDAPFYIADRNEISTTGQMVQLVDEISQRHGVAPFVVIDYLQLLQPPISDDQQRAAMSQVSLDVRNMAQDSSCPIVCISAVNRASYNIIDKRTHKPDRGLALAAAKETGQLEYDAEAICGIHLYNPSSYGDDQYGWVCVAKNRSGGPTGDVPIRYDGVSGNFFEASEDDIAKHAAQEKQFKDDKEVPEAVLSSIREGHHRNIDEIAKACGYSRPKVRQAMGGLLDAGDVTKDPLGVYRVNKGEE